MAKKYKLYMIIISILIILIAIIITSIQKITYEIVLKGENPTYIYKGEVYVEPGYSAFSKYKKDATKAVKIESNLNNNEIGTYQIKYKIDEKTEVIREVIVKELITSNIDIDFSLKGNKIIDIKKGEIYKDPGYLAINDDKDYSKYVEINGIPDTNKVGTYQIDYKLNLDNNKKTLTRIVNVIGEKYTIKRSIETPTNKNLVLTIENNYKDFAYFIAPNNVKIETNNLEYLITNNGIYNFYMYDNKNNKTEISIEISNIDKKPPTGSCIAKVDKNITKYEISANDESGISEYSHNNKVFFDSSFESENSENDEITIYDKAGNFKTVVCEYPPITSKVKTIVNYKSSTLKYWIEKPNKNVAVTHIWLKDSYNQLKTAINSKIGDLETVDSMLNRTLKSKGYNNKGLVVINASGFTNNIKNLLINYSKEWAYSSMAPLIIYEGKIVRNFADKALQNSMYPIYGLKNNGYLGIFYLKGGVDSILENEKTIENIINQKVNYTFSFNPVLLQNSEVKTSNTAKNIRQGLCQIDRNNFLIITNLNPTTNRAVGFSLEEMAEYMKSLDCQTGINLDGGGSVSLLYKTNSRNIREIKKSERKIADILYFVEK